MIWSTEYEVGIELIDEQHKSLFELLDIINDLIDKVEQGRDCENCIRDILSELEDYTCFHFQDEEAILLEIGYDDFDNHKQEHDVFACKIKELLVDNTIDYNKAEALRMISQQVSYWIKNHILQTDFRYIEFMKKNSASKQYLR